MVSQMNLRLMINLIILSIMVGGVGMLFPALSSTYIPYYGSIAKHIMLTNNWADLIQSGHDWLDKPHLPFWITAFFFKIFGINSFAYIFPGFLFNLLGATYTYKLARVWYDKRVALLSVLFYVTSLHLLQSAIDVRAEAYLLGEIMPACYYFLKFDRNPKLKYMLWGALFSGLAMMTKGVFVLVTICSGLVCLWIYKRQWQNFVKIKWWIAIIISFIFVTPELIALYLQFDMHPEKIVFGMSGVSGIRWFFWDSQFGRFFNTGPIMSTNPPPFHWLFFVHTFLWAFLPWWPMFFGAMWRLIRHFWTKVQLHDASVYLFASFFVTFALFSATSFQVDHYTNIIFPFAAILCAKWFDEICLAGKKSGKIIYYIELIISLLLLVIVFIADLIVFNGVILYLFFVLVLINLITMVILRNWDIAKKTIIFPVISILTVFVFAMCVNGLAYVKYDAGYQIAKYLNKEEHMEVVGYKIDLMSLDLYSVNKYISVENLDELNEKNSSVYLVTNKINADDVYKKYPQAMVVNKVSGCSIETFLGNVVNQGKLKERLDSYVILKI